MQRGFDIAFGVFIQNGDNSSASTSNNTTDYPIDSDARDWIATTIAPEIGHLTAIIENHNFNE